MRKLGTRSTAQPLNRHFNEMHKCTPFLLLLELKGFMHDIIVRRNVFYTEFVVNYFCYTVHTKKISLKKRLNANFDENEKLTDFD